MTHIAFMNRSTVVTDDELTKIVAALEVQVTRDWFPMYGTRADLSVVPALQSPPPGAWWITLSDDSDSAGILGYHDLTSEGLPLAKVFAATDKKYGMQVSVTISHELLEMLGDPDINLCAQIDTRLWSYEVCDAVEADAFGYDINGVLVSDFVLPAYFETFRTNGPFDFMNVLKAPLTLAKGGYMSYLDFTTPHGWQQLTAQNENSGHAQYSHRARLGNRRERRRTPRDQWIRSEPI